MGHGRSEPPWLVASEAPPIGLGWMRELNDPTPSTRFTTTVKRWRLPHDARRVQLTMPGRPSWDGKWSGDNSNFTIVREVDGAVAAKLDDQRGRMRGAMAGLRVFARTLC